MKTGLFLFFLTFAVACASTQAELTIVEGFPAKQNGEKQIDIKKDFNQPKLTLRIGELNAIRNLDPLFRTNEASFRVAGWLYEGLLGYDQQGKLVPALASRWQVSPDSLQYTFVIRHNSFFHDNPFLGNGAGRKVTAGDVKKVFERMASAGVPPTAAQLFSNSIRGFDAFFNEQHQVFDSEDRRITEIAGITALDDSTVVFRLNVPDRLLLAKLASPWGFIYPIEAVTTLDKGLKNHPVGTGKFQFSAAQGDSVWTFDINKRHPQAASRPKNAVARVEVVVNANEAALYKLFAAGELQIIPECGPAIARMVLNETNELVESFKPFYKIDFKDALEKISVHHNPFNYDRFSRTDALSLVQILPLENVLQQSGPHLFSVQSKTQLKEASTLQKIRIDYIPGGSRRISIAFTNDLNSRFLSRLIGNEWNKTVPMQLVQSSIISRDIVLHTTRKTVLLPNVVTAVPEESELFSLKMKRLLLSHNNVSGFQQNSWSWWFDVSTAVITLDSTLQP